MPTTPTAERYRQTRERIIRARQGSNGAAPVAADDHGAKRSPRPPGAKRRARTGPIPGTPLWKGYGQFPRWLVPSGVLNAMTFTALRVLMVLIYHANAKDGVAWPSVTLMAGEVGTQTHRVHQALKDLIALGVIVKGDWVSRYRTYQYRIVRAHRRQA